MATSLADAIEFLQTEGGTTTHRPPNFAGQSQITFFIDSAGNGGMTATEVAFVRGAFKAWGDLIDIPIVEVQTITADIFFQYANLTGSSGVTTYDPTGLIHNKLIQINRNVNPIDVAPLLGTDAFQTILHEIGHALGLSHPGPYNGDIFGSAEYGEDTTYPEDFYKFTIMSYFSPLDVSAATGVDEAYWGFAFPWTPMLHDVAAIQSIYGANTATRTGNTVYGFNGPDQQFNLDGILTATRTGSQGVFTIWDSGGIDTIDASRAVAEPGSSIFGSANEFPNQIIDLRQGKFSSVGVDAFTTAQSGLSNNIAIAFGTVIENAIGGGGNDVINGNEVDNRLVGNGGDDKLLGAGGDDTLEGGAGRDLLMGESGNDRLIGGDDADTLLGGSGNDILEGGTDGDSLVGGAGFDTASYANSVNRNVVYIPSLTPPGSVTYAFGDIGGDTFNSIEAWELTRFDDIFEAFETDDTVDGGADGDHIWGLGGDDILIGGQGADTLEGGEGDDNLQGGTEDDILIGGPGNDQLDGGLGADQMTGGSGNDTYFVNDAGDIVSEAFLIAQSGVDLVFAFTSYTLPTGVENLTLAGGAPLDGTGNSVSNIITGNGAANRLDGGGLADTMVGRGGNDTYIVDNAGDIVDESTGGSADIDTVLSSVTFNLANTVTTRGAVENLTLIGAAAINGTGNALANIIIGNSADNILTGNGGDDRLDGGGGRDAMFGGTGNDTYIVDNSNDRVDETTGGSADIDTVLASVTFSLLNQAQTQGNVENVTLTGTANINATGNALSNTLIGNSGRNTLIGGGDNDDLTGGGGNDQLLGGSGSDSYRFSGNFGSDTIDDDSGTADKIVISGSTTLQGTSRSGNDLTVELSTGTITISDHFTTGTIESLTFNGTTVVLAKGLVGADLPGIITGSNQSETLDGRGGDDFLFGGNGNDLLLGGAGNDRLDGENGRDVLDGGTGNDILTGGHGGDSFVFKPGYGHDTITDFSVFEDRLDMSGFHGWQGISFSGATLELDFGNGDALSISFEGGGGLGALLRSPMLLHSWFDL